MAQEHNAAITVRPIGVLRSPQVVHHQAPRQAGLGAGRAGEIHLVQDMQNCLQDLRGFSHIWVLAYLHHARGYKAQVVPPRDTRKRGLFATRAPNRPNPIGLSCLLLLRIAGRVLHVGDHDLLDGTPILDIKPYLPYCDSVPGARTGYVADLPPAGADHRQWWREKDTALPQVYRDLQTPDGNVPADPGQVR
jgi:tRNA (adenine37-N6)-methyltransferase